MPNFNLEFPPFTSMLGLILTNEDKKKIQNSLISLFIKREKILVLGPSGSGKTQFINSLIGTPLPTTKTEFSIPHNISLNNNPFTVVDTPGDNEYEKIRIDAIRNAVNRKNDYIGIIYVVSYGYLKPQKRNNHFSFRNKEHLSDHLKHNRSQEIDMLSVWAPWVRKKSVKWVAILINKADLWLTRKNEVIQYYEMGEFARKISSLKKEVKVETIPYCSVLEPYYNCKVNNSFNELDKTAFNKKFITKILSL